MAKLAQQWGLRPDQIVLGNGSNDILDLIARIYIEDDSSEAISSQYGFSVYALVTQLAGGCNVIVPALNYGHDLTAMQAAITSETKIIWIANPNNPTGAFISYEDLEVFIANMPTKGAIVLDEAYYEYLNYSRRFDSHSWIDQYPNLIIVHTFYKIYGLAGLRVGYALTCDSS